MRTNLNKKPHHRKAAGTPLYAPRPACSKASPLQCKRRPSQLAKIPMPRARGNVPGVMQKARQVLTAVPPPQRHTAQAGRKMACTWPAVGNVLLGCSCLVILDTGRGGNAAIINGTLSSCFTANTGLIFSLTQHSSPHSTSTSTSSKWDQGTKKLFVAGSTVRWAAEIHTRN
jgi:hypothetical protein